MSADGGGRGGARMVLVLVGRKEARGRGRGICFVGFASLSLSFLLVSSFWVVFFWFFVCVGIVHVGSCRTRTSHSFSSSFPFPKSKAPVTLRQDPHHPQRNAPANPPPRCVYAAKSKKQRRIAAKKLRKQALLNPDSLVPKVPVHEQSVDLPAGDGSLSGAVEALGKRVEVTRAMRGVRRKGIKEANFLKGMR